MNSFFKHNFFPGLLIRWVFFLAIWCVPGITPADSDDVLAERPEWREPEAEIRLRVCPPSRLWHWLRVDLPENCREGLAGCAAYLTDESSPLRASPVFLRGEMIAVQIFVLKTKASVPDPEEPIALPVEIYLFSSSRVPRPVVPKEEGAGKGKSKKAAGKSKYRYFSSYHYAPVTVQRMRGRWKTRPFTSEELFRLTGKLPRRMYHRKLEGIGDEFLPSSWSKAPEKGVNFFHFSAAILFEEPSSVRFGGDRSDVAWFVFVDGGVAADWRTSVPEQKGMNFGEAVQFTEGFHRIDFFVVQCRGEEVPTGLMQSGAGSVRELAGEVLHTSNLPLAVLQERRDTVLSAGVYLCNLTRFAVDGSAGQTVVFDAGVLPSSGDFESILKAGGRRYSDFNFESIVHSGFDLPALEVENRGPDGKQVSISLPRRGIWPRPDIVRGRIDIGDMPVVLPSGTPLRIPVRFSAFEEAPEVVKENLALSCRQFDRKGRQLDQICVSMTAFSVAKDVSVKLSPEAARVELHGMMAGRQFETPTGIVVLRPHSSFGAVRALGRRLYSGEERAVLVCDPVQPIDLAGSLRRANRLSAGLLVIVDDFWATSGGPDADLLPEDRLAESLGMEVERFSVTEIPTEGTLKELRKFSLLEDVVASKPSSVLWSVGNSELRAGLRAEDLCLHLLFLAQSTSARDAVPVFLALPPMPGISQAVSRRAALLIKELAFRLGIPVIDAFSGVDATESGVRSFRFEECFVNLGGTIPLAGPNNRGRAWLSRIAEGCLTELLAEEKHSPEKGGAVR